MGLALGNQFKIVYFYTADRSIQVSPKSWTHIVRYIYLWHVCMLEHTRACNNWYSTHWEGEEECRIFQSGFFSLLGRHTGNDYLTGLSNIRTQNSHHCSLIHTNKAPTWETGIQLLLQHDILSLTNTSQQLLILMLQSTKLWSSSGQTHTKIEPMHCDFHTTKFLSFPDVKERLHQDLNLDLTIQSQVPTITPWNHYTLSNCL